MIKLDIWPGGRITEATDSNEWPSWEEEEKITQEFEKWVENEIYRGKFFVLFPSCRSAIFHILLINGIRRSDSVAISKWSSHCVISAVGRLAEPSIGGDTQSAAFVINHQYGASKQLQKTNKYSLIIEDSCDSLILEGRNFCVNEGQYEVISFPKIYGVGWGGGVITASEEKARELRSVRCKEKYSFAKKQYQLKKLYYKDMEKNVDEYAYWGNNDAENVYIHPNAIEEIRKACIRSSAIAVQRLTRIKKLFSLIFSGEDRYQLDKRVPPVISIPYDEYIESCLLDNDIILPVRMINTSKYADNAIWQRQILIPIHQDVSDECFERIISTIDGWQN